MDYDNCHTCSSFKYTKYPTPFCEMIMMSISEIDKCPKNCDVCAEAEEQKENTYEELSYSDKLKIGFGILDPEE